MTISDELRRAVETDASSAKSLAKRAGLHTQTITRWLKGERGMDLATADKIAAALGLSCRLAAAKKVGNNPHKSGVAH